MNEEKASEGLDGSKEPLSRDELFSGPLESPEDEKDSSSEPPQEAKAEAVSTSDPEDSELTGIFADLEKDIPETLKTHATNVKRKLQTYFTKKNQTISEKVKTLEANQITDEIRNINANALAWSEKLQQNPKAGLKELASKLGVSVKELVEAAETPQELTLEFVKANPTAENWAAYQRQEAEKLVNPLKEVLSKIQGTSQQREYQQHGAQVLKDAMDNLPGFAVEADGNKVLSQDADKAIKAVLNGEFVGPNALKNAFRAITAENSTGKVKDLEAKLSDLKKGIRGASTPPGAASPKTTTAPRSPESFWSGLRSEPLG